MRRRDVLKLAAGAAAGVAVTGVNAPTAGAAVAWPPTCNPRIDQWNLAWETRSEHEGWTNRWQGIVATQSHYYMTHNDADAGHALFEGIWRWNHDFTSPVEVVRSSWPAKHPGAPTYDRFLKQIHVPLEGDGQIWTLTETTPGTLATNAGTKYLGGSPSGSPQGEWQIPFLAFNPRDRLVYSCKFDEGSGVNYLYAYDPARNFVLTRTIPFPYKIRRVQGGVFSENGNLYLTSDHSKEVVAYNVHPTENKMWYWGRYNLNCPDLEVEGITLGPPRNYPATGPVRLHVGCVKVDLGTDDVYMKHINVPNPASI
ncbi:hypothetical protein [Streptomyces sp. CB02009]|uniref:hypothetical protein n=1 Tax=Streptomyces sp. CB02009 TaxID=1703938 RepID=UPI000AEFC08F|nr:hypothetical protein [Streptomyces sp. CB02009]